MSIETNEKTERAEAKRLRVMFMTSIYPNPVEPTLGTFHGQLSKELQRICDLRVVTPQPWFPASPAMPWLERWQRFGRIPEAFNVDGVPAMSPKYLMLPLISEAIRPWLMYPSLAATAARLHKAAPIDVINALWLYPDGVVGAKIAKRLGVPLVLTGLGCDVNLCLEEPLKRRQIVSAAHQARAIIVVSQALKDRLAEEGIDEHKISVVTNGVDTAAFAIRDRQASMEALGLTDGMRRLLYVGRLAEEKGVTTLIAAMAKLQQLRSDARLYIVGDGPERPLAEQMVAQLALSNRVTFLGARDHRQVGTWLGASDILCLPSLREGCPNVVLESLASGRPVVASRVGGVPDLLDGRNGRMVPPRDPDALAEAIDIALDTEWKATVIRQSVEDRSWRRTAAAYEQVFRGACGRASTLRLAYRRAMPGAAIEVPK